MLIRIVGAEVAIIPNEFQIELKNIYWFTKSTLTGVSSWKKGESGSEKFPARIGSIESTKIIFMKKFYEVTSIAKVTGGIIIKAKGTTMTIKLLDNGIHEIDWDPSSEPGYTFRIYK